MKTIANARAVKGLLALVMAMAMLLAIVPGADGLVVEISQADYVQGLQRAESFVAVTIQSAEAFKYPKLKDDEEIWTEDFTPVSFRVSIDKNLYGEAIADKTMDLVIWMADGSEMKVGDRFILALYKNDPAERKKLRESESTFEFDPGAYSAAGKLRMEKDGVLWGLAAVSDIHFSSFDNLIEQLEGRAPSNPVADFGDTPVIYYNGQLLLRAYAAEKAPVYQRRDAKSKKLLTLEPYDFVIKIGDTDTIDGQSWEKILMADGSQAYLAAGHLRTIEQGIYKDSNSLVGVPETVNLRNSFGQELAAGRIVKGTAVVLRDAPPYDEALADKYVTLRTGMQNECLVEKASYPEMGRPKGISIKSGLFDFTVEQDEIAEAEEDIMDVPTQDSIIPSYAMGRVDQSTPYYAAPSAKGNAAGSVPKNAHFRYSAAGKGWTQLSLNGKPIYVQSKQVTALTSLRATGEHHHKVTKNAHLYRWDGDAFRLDKDASVYAGYDVLPKDNAVIDGKNYVRLAADQDKDALWMRLP